MTKHSKGILFVLQAKGKKDNLFTFTGSAYGPQGNVVSSVDSATTDTINNWFNSTCISSNATNNDVWVLLPNGFSSLHTIELNSQTAKYIDALVNNHIEPTIAESIEDTKIVYNVQKNIVNALAINREKLQDLENSLSEFEIPASKLLAPQSLLIQDEYYNPELPCGLNDYVYVVEEDQVVGISEDVFLSFHSEKAQAITQFDLVEVISRLQVSGNKLVPNLIANTKEDSGSRSSSWGTSWLGLSIIGLFFLVALSTYGNITLNSKLDIVKQDLKTQFQIIFPNDRIVDLPRQIRSKVASLSSNTEKKSVSITLNAIELVLTQVGNGNHIKSLNWKRGHLSISWQVQNIENLKHITDLLNEKRFNVTLNGWNKLADKAIVGEYQIEATQ